MDPNKARTKLSVTNEIGSGLDDLLDQAERAVAVCDGRLEAFQKAKESVEAMTKHVKTDIDNGTYDLEQGGEINKWIGRCVQVCINLGQQTTNMKLRAMGQKDAMTKAVESVAKFKVAQEQKLEAYATARKAAEEAGEGEESDLGHVVGMRPGGTIKQRRLAAQASKEGAAPESAVQSSEEGALSGDKQPSPETETSEETPQKLDSSAAPKKNGKSEPGTVVKTVKKPARKKRKKTATPAAASAPPVTPNADNARPPSE